MEQSSVQGVNQQVSLGYKLGWLAGIIDGEGSITLDRQSNKGISFCPKLVMGNTNKKIIDFYVQILTEFGVPHHIAYKDNSTKKWKPVWIVTSAGYKRIQTILPLIIPYLVGKREIAELVWQIVQSRLSHYKTTQINRDKPWTTTELQLANQVKLLTRKCIPKTSTTICGTQAPVL